MSSSSAGSFSPGSIASVSEAETCSGQTGREKRILLSSPYAIALRGLPRSCGLCNAAYIECSAARASPIAQTMRASLGQRSGMQSLCLSLNEDYMATRNDNNDQNKADQNKAADEAARTARTVTNEAARVGEQTARAGADVFRRGAETARDSLQSGLNTATETFQRVTDQFTKVLGYSGPQSEGRPRRSSQNLQAVSQASTVLARGAQEVSREVI